MNGLQDAVVVSQAVHQHAYQVASALGNGGLLAKFHTGFYYPQNPVVGYAPQRLKTLLARRWHPDVPADRVTTHLASGVLQAMSKGVPGRTIRTMENAAFALFDLSVARALNGCSDWSVVHAFEGGALHTFLKADGLNRLRVLDVPSMPPLDEWRRGSLRQKAHARRIIRERRLASRVLVPSDQVAEHVAQSGVAERRVQLCPYGVDLERFALSAVSRLPGSVKILFVGHAGRRKGLQDLLAACRHPVLSGRVELTVAGPSATEFPEWREREVPVNWVGSVPKLGIHELYARSDIFVLPTYSEGSALSVIEAMAAGLPVVTTPAAGSGIEHGNDGLLVAPGEVGELASAIGVLIEDVGLRDRLRQSARSRVERELTWPAYERRLLAFYDSLAGELGRMNRDRGA